MWAQLILAVGVVLAAVGVGHLVQSRVDARAAATTEGTGASIEVESSGS